MKPKILLVDDDRFFVREWAQILESSYDVSTCHSPSEAMNRNYLEFQYVIVDFHFAGHEDTGETVGRHIARQCPLVARILLTAYGDDAEMRNKFNRVSWDATIDKQSSSSGAIALLERITKKLEEATEHANIRIADDYNGLYPIDDLACEPLAIRLNALELAFAHVGKENLTKNNRYVKEAYRIQFLACAFMNGTGTEVLDGGLSKKINDMIVAHGKKQLAIKKKIKEDVLRDYNITMAEPSAWPPYFKQNTGDRLAIEGLRFRHLIMKFPGKWPLTCNWYSPANKLVKNLGLARWAQVSA